MSCSAILVGDGRVRPVTAEEAAQYSGPGFIWVHIDAGTDEELGLLRGSDIPDVAANALVATETRPRCDRIDEGNNILDSVSQPAHKGVWHRNPAPSWKPSGTSQTRTWRSSI